MLSSSARIDKSKRKAKPLVRPPTSITKPFDNNEQPREDADGSKRKKKQHSAEKLEQIHKEEMSAFRRRMGIKLSSDNKHDDAVPDPISSFREWNCPKWWLSRDGDKVRLLFRWKMIFVLFSMLTQLVCRQSLCVGKGSNLLTNPPHDT